MNHEKFNIDKMNDDTYLSITQLIETSGVIMESVGSSAVLVVNLSPDGHQFAGFAGDYTRDTWQKLKDLVDEIGKRLPDEEEAGILVDVANFQMPGKGPAER